MRKKKERSELGQTTPGWITTFGDAMSLLLCFFVMLFAATSLNEVKVKQGLGSLKGALGGIVEGVKKESIIPQKGAMERLSEGMKEYIVSEGLEKEVKISSLSEGISISLSSPAFFDSGKAKLRKEAFPLLNKIITLLKEIPNQIRIEGHTDNLPIHTEEFPSNWELSAARAINVGKYLIKGKISPERIGVIGYADSRPLFPNDTPEHRALNRRVEIFILK